MVPKVQGTRNDSIHQVPPSCLSAKTLQHCKHTGLNQAYFTRSLIINTFFASLPGVNFIRKKARVCGSIASLLYAVCLYRAYGRWTLSLHIYIMNSWLYQLIKDKIVIGFFQSRPTNCLQIEESSYYHRVPFSRAIVSYELSAYKQFLQLISWCKPLIKPLIQSHISVLGVQTYAAI